MERKQASELIIAVAPHVVKRIRTLRGKLLYVRQAEERNQVIDPR